MSGVWSSRLEDGGRVSSSPMSRLFDNVYMHIEMCVCISIYIYIFNYLFIYVYRTSVC